MPTSSKQSAGLLLHRLVDGEIRVLLVHPGGPFWAKKDAGAWSIPKGEYGDGDDGGDPLTTARRELAEETGLVVDGPFVELPTVTQKGGKVVRAWAVEAPDCDPATLTCASTVEIEWPPRSGKRLEFPEVDRAELFDLQTARQKINPAQVALLDALEERRDRIERD